MSEIVQDRYWLVARDKPGLLIAMMKHLAGNSYISFEGDLSQSRFPQDLPLSSEETDVLRRQTSRPIQDFAILPLTANTIQPILDVILPDNKYMISIDHIQIAKDGKLEFGAYDNFHHECIVCFLGVSTDLLNKLQANGVLRSWTTPHDQATRWHG